MLELIEIKPLDIVDEDIKYLKGICKKVFKEHEFRFEASGFVYLTKDSWANPESFSMHWYEFVVNILPEFTLPKYYKKWFIESCVMPPKNQTQKKLHPIAFLKIHAKI
jgi:hypothetical protein